MDYEVIYHHGVKGMRWGIRRYQRKDGSLTKAGQRRLAKQRAANLEKARQARAEKKVAEAERAKKVSEDKLSAKKMTDKEINDRLARIELEKKYKAAVKENNSYSKGKQFLNKFSDTLVDKLAEKLADKVTADLVAQTIKYFGVKTVNSIVGETAVYTNNKKKD